ncbi:pilus assembly protein [Microbulbifer sp. PSTR4-B]|uniref:pilus assembly protein n=1 Tax=Microbulbifer sp. PSTR4-B TaxID=3243396 RepID=UPI0040392FE2
MRLKSDFKNKINFRTLNAALLLTLPTSTFAAPGNLSDVPLYSRGSAEPNIMFLLDSSGSMQKIVYPPSEYDVDANDKPSCSSPLSDEGYDIRFAVSTSSGAVLFSVDGGDTWKTWNSTTNCFDEEEEYRARLYANTYASGGAYFYTDDSNNYEANVTGDFLNWYFSDETSLGSYVADKFLDEDGNPKRSKVDIRRTDVMKSAAKDLVSQLEDVRIGLMQFNGNHGGRMLQGLTSLTSDNRSSILNVIDEIGAGGNTPLAESFAGVGRYFITGYENQKLNYKDSNGNNEQESASKIFAGYSSGSSESTILDWGKVSKPDATVSGSAIQYYCQKSFMVALTDGAPTKDNSVSDILYNFDTRDCSSNPGGCTNDKMDDVIKALYDVDLRPDLKNPDDTPVINNITSYLIGFANQGLSDSKVMKNAGELGGGGVYSADNASQLQLTFNKIFKEVQAITGSSGSVAFNSTVLDSGSAIFAAQFNSGNWNGNLSAWSLDSSGVLADSPTWQAAPILDALSDVDTRVMLTYQDNKGVPFTAAGVGTSSSDHAKDLTLYSYITNAEDDGRVSDRIDFLRGDRSKEGGKEGEFRERESRLGDIVNSTPVYVGGPNARWSEASFPESTSYTDFKAAKKDRTPIVYVGANDGFLHGFNASMDTTNSADAGKEVIAYSPSILLSEVHDEGLHPLSSQYYDHKFYVDGTPTVSDAYINDKWQTILVGGLNAGGKGYYALNVTDPTTFSEENAENIVMWEFSDKDNENLGFSFSRPQIGRMANNEWAAIFGNGYNSKTGDAGIFIVYLDGSDASASKYTYLSTGKGSASNLNGMSTPAIIDSNLDGIIDRVYAGDLQGNMWAFDVSSADSSRWSVIKSSATGFAEPLFTATGEAITAPPLVVRNIKDTESPGLLVTFGTGQYLVDTDTADKNEGGFYAVSDNGTYGLTKTHLTKRSLVTESISDGSLRRKIDDEAAEVDWSSEFGWYIPLQAGDDVNGGERVITRPSVQGYVLFFNTMIPSGQVCSAGGSGWLMSVDIWSGVAPENEVFDGDGSGTIDSNDYGYVGEYMASSSPNESGFIDNSQTGNKIQSTGNSAGGIDQREVKTSGGGRIGRLSWEEITPF